MRQPAPNLRHLRAISEVAALHSISMAADRVHLSQSALTQAIAKLEKRLSCRLFLRHAHGLQPTFEGKLFLHRINRCLFLLQQGVREAMRSGLPRDNQGPPSEHPAQLITNSQLRALISIQSTGSFSGAARALDISQPAIHRSARDLENSLNLSLFERTTLGLSLTRSAQRLARFARLALKEIESGFDELSSLSGADTTTITIGSRPLARAYLLPATINRISELKPALNVRIIEGSYAHQLEQLLTGDIDFVIGALPPEAPTDQVTQEFFFETPLSLVTRAGHPLAGKETVTAKDLNAYPWALPRRGTPIRALFDELFPGLTDAPGMGLLECSSQVVLREVLAGSDRITFVPAHQIHRELQAGTLTILNIAMPTARRPIGLSTRKDWHPTPSHQLFLSILRAISNGVETTA